MNKAAVMVPANHCEPVLCGSVGVALHCQAGVHCTDRGRAGRVLPQEHICI